MTKINYNTSVEGIFWLMGRLKIRAPICQYIQTRILNLALSNALISMMEMYENVI